MEMNGQLHTPSALPPGKEPSSGWAPDSVRTQLLIFCTVVVKHPKYYLL
jgi:hypothetical protein